MGLAYGTPIPRTMDGPQLDVAERQALDRWPLPADQVLWRIEAVSYSSGIDPDAELYGSTPPRLELFARGVKRWTPCGARLDCGRWVDLREGCKQWASRTPAEALLQFQWRRLAQIRILERQLARAQQELALTGGERDLAAPAVG